LTDSLGNHLVSGVDYLESEVTAGSFTITNQSLNGDLITVLLTAAPAGPALLLTAWV
jgi:hypothetical protein